MDICTAFTRGTAIVGHMGDIIVSGGGGGGGGGAGGDCTTIFCLGDHTVVLA